MKPLFVPIENYSNLKLFKDSRESIKNTYNCFEPKKRTQILFFGVRPNEGGADTTRAGQYEQYFIFALNISDCEHLKLFALTLQCKIAALFFSYQTRLNLSPSISFLIFIVNSDKNLWHELIPLKNMIYQQQMT